MLIAPIIVFILQSCIRLTLAENDTNSNCTQVEEYVAGNDKISNVTEILENIAQLHPIYPDLRCYKGYYINNSQSGSEKILKGINENCTAEVEINNDVCYKQCVMQRLHVLNNQKRLNHEIIIAEFLELVISYGRQNHTGHVLSKAILRNCEEKYNRVKHKHCSEWTEFYECVDDTWKCIGYITRFKPRKLRRIIVQTKCLSKIMK